MFVFKIVARWQIILNLRILLYRLARVMVRGPAYSYTLQHMTKSWLIRSNFILLKSRKLRLAITSSGTMYPINQTQIVTPSSLPCAFRSISARFNWHWFALCILRNVLASKCLLELFLLHIKVNMHNKKERRFRYQSLNNEFQWMKCYFSFSELRSLD